MNDVPVRLATALADRYTIERELGAGGMATVYLAHDIKHDRQVAVKVLRPELAAVIGAERFLAEIKTTANLQHPHILPLFDSGVADSFLFYVMPFIEGESLRDRLSREKQLPIGDAVRLATEVASALDYAHRHGVIHRDIKPENILLHDGSALVADFGIALAASKAGTRMTETGMSLGTPQYMSPEQAMGERELDARSDIYALGCVTYEMLSGEPPFSGPTAQAIVAKVMTAEPQDLSSLRKTIPTNVADAVQTALHKLPADRFATAAEFASALKETRSEMRDARSERNRSSHLASRISNLGLAAVIAIVAFLTFMLGARVAESRTLVPVVLGHATHVTWDAGLEVTPALSPDGRSVAYSAGPVSNPHIVVRVAGEGRAVRLTGDTTNQESNPTWSPDGTRVVFLSRSGVYSAPAGGGPARPEIPGNPTSPVLSAVLSPDGNRLAFTRVDSLFVREKDGKTRGVAPMREGVLCSWSPDGVWVACATGNALYALPGSGFGNLSPGRLTLCRMSDGLLVAATDSTSLNTSPVWSQDGKWLYFVSSRDGRRDIYVEAVGHNGQPAGAPVRLSVGLGAHTISLSGAGSRLAYSLYTARTSAWFIPLPTHPIGMVSSATRVTSANEYIESFSGSADGKWLYYDTDITGNDDIFRIPVLGGEAERLTTDPADDFAPVPSPDGKSFAFHSWRSGSRDVLVQRLDDGAIEQVAHSPMQEALASWSPDGQAIQFSEFTMRGGIWIAHRNPAGGWGAPVLRLDHGSGGGESWSPDGRYIVLLSGLIGGNMEIVPVDSGPGRVLVDIAKTGLPVEFATWSGTSVVFTSHDARSNYFVYSVPASGGPPTRMFAIDPIAFPMYRGTIAIAANRFFFESEDRQSDIWLIDVKKQ